MSKEGENIPLEAFADDVVIRNMASIGACHWRHPLPWTHGY